MIDLLIGLLLVIYGVVLVLVWHLKMEKQNLKVVYIPTLDKELSNENYDLKSKIRGLQTRIENALKSYEKALTTNKEMRAELDEIFKIQNKYKEVK